MSRNHQDGGCELVMMDVESTWCLLCQASKTQGCTLCPALWSCGPVVPRLMSRRHSLAFCPVHGSGVTLPLPLSLPLPLLLLFPSPSPGSTRASTRPSCGARPHPSPHRPKPLLELPQHTSIAGLMLTRLYPWVAISSSQLW